jgi:uncharacterized Zn finger protein
MSSEITRNYERRAAGPRRVAGGLKLKRSEPDWSRRSIAGRWLALFDGVIDPTQLDEGLGYAHAGQVVRVDTAPGELVATVQGRLPRPYEVRLKLQVLTDQQWTDVVNAMAREAIYVARMLAEELPTSTLELFAEQGAQLIPADSADLQINCSCGASDACKHVAAVVYLFAEHLEHRPVLALTLGGMESQRVLDRLLQARAGTSAGPAAQFDPKIPGTRVAAAPLDSCLEDYWRPANGTTPTAGSTGSDVPHALLRRMGTSPLGGKFPMVGLLASIYDAVASVAQEIEDRVETPQSDDAGE